MTQSRKHPIRQTVECHFPARTVGCTRRRYASISVAFPVVGAARWAVSNSVLASSNLATNVRRNRHAVRHRAKARSRVTTLPLPASAGPLGERRSCLAG
jgi:hypothetical protein